MVDDLLQRYPLLPYSTPTWQELRLTHHCHRPVCSRLCENSVGSRDPVQTLCVALLGCDIGEHGHRLTSSGVLIGFKSCLESARSLSSFISKPCYQP